MLEAMTPLPILLYKAYQIRTLQLVPHPFQLLVHQPDVTISDSVFK